MYSVQSSTERALHGRQADAHAQLVLITHGAAGALAAADGRPVTAMDVVDALPDAIALLRRVVQTDTARDDDHIRPDGRSHKKSATLPKRQSTLTVLLAPGLRDPCSLYTVLLV